MPISCAPPTPVLVPSIFHRSAPGLSALSKSESKKSLDALASSVFKSEVLSAEVTRMDLEAALDKVASYPDGWDSYGAPAPSLNTVAAANVLLAMAFELRFMPVAIVASAEGGVATYFFAGGKTAYIEYNNSGEAVAVMYENAGEPVVAHVNEGKEAADVALKAIREYFA